MKKIIELIILFIGAPAFLLVDIHPIIKVTTILLLFIYVLVVSFKIEKINLKKEFSLKTTSSIWKTILIRFAIITILSTSFLYFFNPNYLFNVVRANVPLWLVFVLIYSFLSVIPQEFLYRTFFFKRYQHLFKNSLVFLFVNATLFSFAHIWFLSWVVLAFTFVGGILFFYTYKKTLSLLILCIEHAIYGSWLYTVGYGEMFMFPVK